MILKFQNKYRIKSIRFANFDYASNGAYFITICCKKMKHYFGHVCEGTMILNEHGEIAEQMWAMIPQHFPFISLGSFQIMPNHMHGILIIDRPASVASRFIASDNNVNHNDADPFFVNTDVDNISETQSIASDTNVNHNNADPFSVNTDVDNISETRSIASIRGTDDDDANSNFGGATGINNPMLHENIGRVIRWYKGRCTFEIRKNLSEFTWQSSYWDSIIKNSNSYENIQNYIKNNPKKWSEDRFYK